MNNPMYEVQLNRHEEQISDINGRLHSYDLALRWCEGQIKKITGDDYSPVVVLNDDKEALEQHNDNQRKEINQLLKANEELKREIQGLKTMTGSVEKEYDKLKNDHNLLKEAYAKLDDRYNREKEIWSEKHNELQDSNNLKNCRISSLEKGMKTQSDVINQKNSEICYLKSEIEKWKEACLRHQVDVNNFQGAYTEATEKVKILNENIEHLERENEYLRELYSCTVESSKKIIDKLKKENKE